METKKPKAYKIYLPEEVKEALEKKARATCYNATGAISRYLTKIATEDIIFVDENTRAALKIISSS